MEHNKKIYLTSDGTKETGKKIIAYLEYLGGDKGNYTYLSIANNDMWIYWFIDDNNRINSYQRNGLCNLNEYESVDINTILFDDNYNVIGFKDDIKEDADDLDNTKECFEKIVNNIKNKNT